jgi:2'-5' RNA ligase
MRLFFALPVPQQAREQVRPLLEGARRAGGEGVSFTKIDQLHFTLAFLGEQPGADEALAAGESLREGGVFEVVLSGVGAFPNMARPRVLWIGVGAGAAQMIDAAERLRNALRQRGFELEERKLRPHLTVGRVRPRGERFAKKALAEVRASEFARWTAREAYLMQSVLGKGGATHTVLRAFPFR